MQLSPACIHYFLAKAVLPAGNFGCGVWQIAAYPKAALKAAAGKLLKQHTLVNQHKLDNQHKHLQQHQLHTSSHVSLSAGSRVFFKPLSLPILLCLCMPTKTLLTVVACLAVRPAAQVADLSVSKHATCSDTRPHL